MKILQTNMQNAKGVQSNRTGKAKASGSGQGRTESKGSVSKGDQVSISGSGQQMRTLATELKNTPDVRTSKVDAMKAQIEQGYNPPAEQIADAIIRTVQSF